MSYLRTLAALVMTCGAVLLPAAPAHASTYQVMIHNYAYSPASLVVAQGDTVTWTNMDTAQHDVSVTKGPTTFKSPMLAQGKSWSFTFSSAGSYSYICSVHPDMKASVTVKAAARAPETTPTAAAPVTSTHTTTATKAAAPKASTAAAKPTRGATPSAQAAPVATGPVATTSVDPSEATLSPLLIVLGISAAVMVFCMLLMASRPQIVVDEGDDDE